MGMLIVYNLPPDQKIQTLIDAVCKAGLNFTNAEVHTREESTSIHFTDAEIDGVPVDPDHLRSSPTLFSGFTARFFQQQKEWMRATSFLPQLTETPPPGFWEVDWGDGTGVIPPHIAYMSAQGRVD